VEVLENAFAFILPASWLVQIICLVHALITRRYHWIWVLLVIPIASPIAYFFMEIRPSLSDASRVLELPMFARMRVGRLEREFRFLDSAENRVALAEAYLNRGRTDEALTLYKPCHTGVFRVNVDIQFGYARALYVAGDHEQAVAVLEAAEPLPSTHKRRERWLLLAMAHEKLGHSETAEACYRKAAPGFVSEEARARLGLFLWQAGRRDEAAALFTAILEHAGFSDRRYRRQERIWLRLARRHLAELDKPTQVASVRAESSGD
jgi:hypothetical protein